MRSSIAAFSHRFGLALLSALPLAACWSGGARAVTFKHIVIIIQENRTPDNIFGSNPNFEAGVDIATNGVTSQGATIALTPVALANCYDLLHTHQAFEATLNGGADLDQVVKAKGCDVPANPQFKYVDNSTGTVQPYFDLATSYGFANRMFQTSQGGSFAAHQFLFGGTSSPSTDSSLFASENKGTSGPFGCIARAGQTVTLIDGFGSETSNPPIYPCFERPTLTDLLEAADPPVTWRYYAPKPGSIWTAPDAIDHICQPEDVNGKLACSGPDWTNGNVVANNSARILADIAKCRLQNVSWAIPTGPQSDHARYNNGSGPQWVAAIVNAIGTQPACHNGETYWNDTAVIITWDDWGGWYDHVKPFQINVQPGSPAAWGDGYTYGFRVPMLVVSAFTQAGVVSNNIYDAGSILYFIESNFNLGFIGPGDTIYSNYADFQAESRGNLSEFFGLSSPRSFTDIPTRMKPKDFIDAPPSPIGPDDD